MDLSADGSLLATANSDHTPKIWDVDSGRLLRSLAGHEDRVDIIDLGADGELAVTVGQDDSIMIWRVDTGDELVTIRDFQCGKQLFASCDVAFSPDGATLAAGTDDGRLAIMDISSLLTGPQEISFADLKTQSAHANSISGVTFNSDGTQIATTSWDGFAKVWDATTRQLQRSFVRFYAPDYGSAFSRDGSRLAVTSTDGTVRVWEIETGEILKDLRGHTGTVWGVDFSPDGLQIATAGTDGTVKLWEAETGELLITLTGHTSGVSDVAFSPDGTRLYTASVDGTSRVYLLDIDELMDLARERLSRGFTQEECRQYLHLEACPIDR